MGLAEHLLDRAVAQTGLDDFGPADFREPLELLYQANLDAAPPPETMAFTEALMVKALKNRLRVFDYAARHPEVRDAPVPRPLVVMGMPRSGTSLTSYLLGADTSRRSLLTWEAWDSAPPPTTATLRTDPRCLALLAEQRAEWAASPDEVRPHVEFADGPTECIRVQAQDFKALMWEAYVPVRAYSRWIMGADMTSAYEYQKLVLQILQSKAPGNWALKMPSHALHIEALIRVFPDARLVWTHRNPLQALSSLFSMKSARWNRLNGKPSIDWLREHYTIQLTEHVNRPLALRRRLGWDRIYDIRYADMLRDPIGTLRSLYDWAGDDFTPQAEAAMQGWLSANPQGRFGQHRHSLDQFGLTEATLRPLFEDYLDSIAIESEG